MAYRRGGGGGGGPGHGGPNRNFFNRQSNPIVNPWQGGMAPGGGVGQINAQSILGQLSEPQAQLALALSNLLTQPQQQMNNPPSLLSLDVNPRGGFNNNNAGFQNNFPQRNVNRGRPDFRRHDNFNTKNNYRDRDVGNKKSSPNRRNYPNRKQTDHRSRSRDKAKDNYSAKSAEHPTKKSSSNSQSDKPVKEEGASKNDEICVKEDLASRSEPEDAVEEKRDWKAEKNTSDGNLAVEDADDNKDDGSGKDNSAKAERGSGDKGGAKKGSFSSGAVDDKDRKRNRDGKYGGIPASYLICTLCNKRMWDGESFEKHLRGRAHQQIVDSVENSYKLKCNMMRESLRLEEEKKNIEMNRMKRSGKNMKQQQLSHCNMCDLQFYGHLVAHRRSAGHQRLKAFLHPKCKQCNKEFPNRMEWTSHNMTPEHLLKVWQLACKLGKTDIPIEKSEEGEAADAAKRDDELFDDCDDPEPENAILDLNMVTVQKQTSAAEEDAEVPEGAANASAAAGTLANISSRIPLFKPDRLLGESSVKPVSGFHCELCPCFLLTEEERIRHLKSQRHYNAFVAELNRRAMSENRREKKKRSGDDAAGDDEGNWKRRKVAQPANDKEDDKDKEDEAKDAGENAQSKKNDCYDPSDPTEEVDEGNEEDEEDPDLTLVATTDDGETKAEEIEDDVWAEVDSLIVSANKDDETAKDGEVAALDLKKQEATADFKREPEVKIVKSEVDMDDVELSVPKQEPTPPSTHEASPASTPGRTTRRGGQVRNGAGPKSKRGRRGQ